MNEVAIASINTFGPSPKAGFESPSDQLITLTAGQLQDLLGAIQDLRDEVSQLQATITKQAEKIVEIEAAQDIQGENQFIQLQLINQIKDATKKEPQPLQRDRSEILRALLAANGGKMLQSQARKKMHLSKQAFTNLLATCGFIETRPYHLDRRQSLLIIK